VEENRKWLTAIAGAVALFAVLWATGLLGGGDDLDPEVRELVDLSKQRVSEGRPDSPQDREAQADLFRARMESFTPDQRMSFMQQAMPLFATMMEKRIDQFLALSPKEQQAEMDKRINEMEARRKQAGGGQRGPGGPGGPMGFGGDPKQADAMRKRMLDSTTPEQRAKFEAMMGMFNDRRRQRGLDPIGPRGG
jgi:hypothetical protein